MLFHSYEFLFLFVPITIAIFALSMKFFGVRSAQFVLVAASAVFYRASYSQHLFVLFSSILLNFFLGSRIANDSVSKQSRRLLLLWTGVGLNIGMLGVLKYIVPGILLAEGTSPEFFLVAPLAISFFTFQQIAYLVDVYQGRAPADNLLIYCLFVSFFPQLVAGPIVKYDQIKVYFENLKFPDSEFVAKGITLMSLGLGKKLLIADQIHPLVSSVDQAILLGSPVTFLDSWLSSLLYSFQIYFDFSGYCDLALGLGLIFGVALPFNFSSPYKAASIREFWSRWHITLSNFFRDYLYIPLGGSRGSQGKTTGVLLVVMVLAGLWHGFGVTFLVWGLLHGFAIVLEHIILKRKKGRETKASTFVWLKRPIVFLFVTVTWVFFRSDSVGVALSQMRIMADPFNELAFTPKYLGEYQKAAWIVLIAYPFVTLFPNSQQILALDPNFTIRIWRPSFGTVCVTGLIIVLSIIAISKPIDFIYFRF